MPAKKRTTTPKKTATAARTVRVTTPATTRRKVGLYLDGATRDELQAAFLVVFRNTGVVRTAADAIGVSRDTVYDWRQRYPDFAAAYDAALADADDVIRTEIRRRAVEGWLEPVYQGGKKVGSVRRYSDSMLKLLASSRMHEFRDRVDVTTAGVALGNPDVVTRAAQDPSALAMAEAYLARVAGYGAPEHNPSNDHDDSDSASTGE